MIDAVAAMGRAHLLLGDPGAAEQDFRESLELARAHHDEVGRAQALIGFGGAHLVLGDYTAAETALGEGLELTQGLGEVHASGVAMAWLGDCARRRGEEEAARAWFCQAAELARNVDHPYPLVLALVGLGRLALDAGDGNTGAASFGEALLVARERSLVFPLASCLCGLAGTTAEPARARLLANEAIGVAERCGDRAGAALAVGEQARLDGESGNLQDATRRHQTAVTLWAQIGDPAGIAASLEALAVLAVAEKRFSPGVRLLAAAESLRERHQCVRTRSRMSVHLKLVEVARLAVGASTYEDEWRKGRILSTEEAVAYAGRQRTRRAKRPAAGWEALTEAEQRVAELVAEGKTNIEIARKLIIAPATVKAHLRHVYAKVSVQSRTALVACMHQRERH